MALKPVTNTAASFEDMDDTAVVENPSAQAAMDAPVTAVAVAKPAALAAFSPAANTIGALKDAFKVSYDTLTNLIASNGNICYRENKKPVGDSVTFELMSWQDSWVVTHSDDKAPKELIRYSDDGITCSDGTSVQEHLEELRSMGYARSKVNQRAVVVGSVISATRAPELTDELVQFDLAPQSRSAFQRYMATAMNKQRLGKATPEQVTKVRATAVIAVANGKDFTKLEFAVA